MFMCTYTYIDAHVYRLDLIIMAVLAAVMSHDVDALTSRDVVCLLLQEIDWQVLRCVLETLPQVLTSLDAVCVCLL